MPVARECVRRFPTVCENHFWLGQVYLELGNYEEARRCHQEAIRIDPNSPLPYFPLRAGLRPAGEERRGGPVPRTICGLASGGIGGRQEPEQELR